MWYAIVGHDRKGSLQARLEAHPQNLTRHDSKRYSARHSL